MKTINNYIPRRKLFYFGILLATLCLCGLPLTARAQGTMATAQISSSPAGNGTYNYAMTLNNTGGIGIGTFWYAWIPGLDFLSAYPNSVQTPGGWSYIINGGYYGYSIQFTTGTSPLAPGDSLSGFGFNSSENPNTINNGTSFGYPINTSYTYGGAPFSDAGYMFVVQPVPEPSTIAFVAVGLILLMFLLRPGARKLS